MKIGFIGLGIMGSRMAQHLLTSGYELVVHNRSADKAEPLLAQGAVWADTPAQVGMQTDILITMLAHPQAIRETALGSKGFLHTLKQGTLWVDSSTLTPSFTRTMVAEASQRNIRMLDAPVAGSKNQAQNKELVFLVGGSADDVAESRPLFEAMGSRVVHVGNHGMGISLKVVVNYLLATSMAAFAEGLVLGEALGLSKEMLLKVLVGGPIVPPYMAGKQAKLVNGDYEAEFPLKWMHKDLQMATQAAYETGVAMPSANSAKELYQLAVRHGLGEVDFSVIYEFLREEKS